MEPAISTDRRVTESGSEEESSAATAATNATVTNGVLAYVHVCAGVRVGVRVRTYAYMIYPGLDLP